MLQRWVEVLGGLIEHYHRGFVRGSRVRKDQGFPESGAGELERHIMISLAHPRLDVTLVEAVR